VKVGGGEYYSLALRSDGSLTAWGHNSHGQLDVPEGSDFVDIAAGSVYCTAIKSDGSIVSWGYQYDANNLPSGYDFVDIAAGPFECVNLALKSDGSLAAWGQNIYGQCIIPETNDFTDIAVGSKRCLVLKKDGTLLSWGSEYYPIDPNEVDSYEDILLPVPDGNDFVDVECGMYHDLAIKSDGTIEAWGRNINGQCNVPSGNDFVAIAAGDEHSMALTSGEDKILTVSTKPAGLDCVIPCLGENIYYGGQRVFINAPRCPKCPDVYKFDHWDGGISEPRREILR